MTKLYTRDSGVQIKMFLGLEPVLLDLDGISRKGSDRGWSVRVDVVSARKCVVYRRYNAAIAVSWGGWTIPTGIVATGFYKRRLESPVLVKDDLMMLYDDLH